MTPVYFHKLNMMFQFPVFIVLLIIVSTVLSQDESVVTVQIQHSLNGNDFLPRSNILLNFKDGKNSIVDQDHNGILPNFIDGYKDLLLQNGAYLIRVNSQIGNSSSPYVMASIPACELQKSGFKEDVILNLDQTNSYVIGISYSSPIIALSRPCDPKKISSPQLFHTRIKIAEKVLAQIIPLQILAPRPPYLANMKLGLEDEEKAGGANPQNQSFLVRYWYLVLPMVLYMFLPSSADVQTDAAKTRAKKSS